MLRRYLVKDDPEIDLDDLDFGVINKEIEEDRLSRLCKLLQLQGRILNF